MTDAQRKALLDPFFVTTLERWCRPMRPAVADAGVLEWARNLGLLDDNLRPTKALLLALEEMDK